MALTQFEKDCLDEIHAELIPKNGRKVSDPAVQANIDIIVHGEEDERKALISSYISNEGLARMAMEIEACDLQIDAIAKRKTELEDKLLEMQDYVA